MSLFREPRGRGLVESVLVQERCYETRRIEKKRVQWDGSDRIFHDHAFLAPEGTQPPGNLPVVSDGGGEEKQTHPDGKVDHDLFPYHPPVFVSQKVGFIQDDKVIIETFAPVHGFVQLVPQDLGCPDDDGGIRIFLGVSGQDSDLSISEYIAKLGSFRVGQGLEGRGVPAASSLRVD